MGIGRRTASLALALVAAACGGDDGGGDTDPEPTTWPCPEGWVAWQQGGCAPAAIACDDVGALHEADCEGAMGSAVFRRGEGGTWRGDWPASGDPGGPPAPGSPFPADCPEGWSHDDDALGCAPTLADCAAGSAPLPDGGCTATAPCPAGDWAELPAEADGAEVVHLRAGADATAADGSPEAPFASLADAIDAAGDGGWVRIAPGTYDAGARVTGELHLLGTCASDVTLRPGDADAVLHAAGSDAALDLRDVTLAGDASGVVAEAGGSVALANVVLASVRERGLLARGAGSSVEATDCIVRDTRPAPDGRFGRGLQAWEGGRLEARRVVVDGGHDQGALALGTGSELVLADSVVRGVRTRPDGFFGYGISAADGGALSADRTLVRGVQRTGALAQDAGSTVALRRVRVENVARTDEGPGHAVTAILGGAVEADGLWASDIEGGAGLHVGNPGSLRVSGAVVRDVTAGAYTEGGGVVTYGGSVRLEDVALLSTDGVGLLADFDATLAATRVLVRDARVAGALALGTGARIELEEAHVSATRTDADGAAGYGLVAADGGALEARRSVVRGSGEVGVVVMHAGSSMALEGSVVFDTQGTEAGTLGWCAFAQTGASLVASRTLFDGCLELGVGAGYGGSLALADSAVRNVEPGPRAMGMGVVAVVGGSVEADRLIVERVHASAVVSRGMVEIDAEPATLEVRDLFVLRTRSASIGYDRARPFEPSGRPVAYGLHTAPGGTLRAERAVIDEGGYGLFASGGSTLELRTAVIARQADAAGARNGTEPALTDVTLVHNARDEIVDDATLPEAAALPPPTEVCADADCE